MASCRELAALDPAVLQAKLQQVRIDGPGVFGGQKAVFPCSMGGTKYALKLIPLPDTDAPTPEEREDEVSITLSRIQRELEIMAKCRCDHLVKLGPLEPGLADLLDGNSIYYCEEWIDGLTVQSMLNSGVPMKGIDIATLGRDSVRAIETLRRAKKIHRDIKPANIMRRNSDGSYVLLDLGFAFDLEGESLSRGPVGTYPWFSPEQFNFSLRRQLDFRSDLFSLGAVMYTCASGKHPFWARGMSYEETAYRIAAQDAEIPIPGAQNMPDRLEAIIAALLAKKPHLRPSICNRLERDLSEILEMER